jgi:hypothetical protein
MAVGVTELLQQSTTIKISVTPATILNSILLMSHPWVRVDKMSAMQH